MFADKGNRFITHMLKLRDIAGPLADVLASGVFELKENMEGKVALDAGPRRPVRHAVEIRHDRFRGPAFIAMLRRYNVALVVADTAGRWPQCEDVTADFVHIRLHGDEELYASG